MTKSVFCAAILALLLAMSMALPGAAQAETFTVDVGGTSYDIETYSQAPFFLEAGTLTDTANAPWWGNASLANQVATALVAEIGEAGTAYFQYLFAYAASDSPVSPVSTVSFWGAGVDKGVVYQNTAYSAGDPTPPTAIWMTGSVATAVPEINGPVLAQVALILLAFYLVLVGFRRRDDLA